jgi:nitroreductase
MELINAVRGRRSIRKFKSDEIPRDIVQEILAMARWAPSWGNTQPWEFYVLTGKPLEEFKKENREFLVRGQSVTPDVPMPEVWPDHLKRRYGEIGGILLKTLNINREDKEARNKLYEDMALLFGAPCLIVACIPSGTLVEYAMLDVGLILQTICLLAYDKGIGTCIMAMAVRHPGLLRKIISIPEDRKIITGVVLGYPDQEFPLNNFERKRADISEYVKWIDD